MAGLYEDVGTNPSLMSNNDADAKDRLGRRARACAIGVIVTYLVLLPVAAFGAIHFLKRTVMMYSAPPGSMVAETNELSNRLFRKQVFHDPLLLLVESRELGVPVYEAGNDELCELTRLVASFNSSDFTHVVGYCPYKWRNASVVAKDFVSSNNVSSLLVADFVMTSTITGVQHTQNRLMDMVQSVAGSRFPHLSIQFTSVGLVSSDLVHDLVKDLMTIDAVSIPFAMAAMAFCLRSIRMLLLPGAVLPVVVCFAFGISYLVSLAINVSSFAPEMASATMLAITIDYSLFIASRFLEIAPRYELEMGGDSPHTRYRVCYETARRSAHNIIVSGMTIGVALGGLILMPVKFIGSIGYIFFVSCTCAVIVSLTLMPSILLAFYPFFRQETDFGRPIRWLREKMNKKEASSGGDPADAETGATNGDALLISDRPLATKAVDEKSYGANDDVDGGGLPHYDEAKANFDADLRKRQYNSIWFKVGRVANSHPIPVIIAVFAIGTPFFWAASTLKVDFDLFHQVPRSSPHGKTLQYTINNIGNGQATPFYITMDTSRPGSFIANESRAELFTAVQNLSRHLNNHVHQGLDRFESFAMVDGIPIAPWLADWFKDSVPDYAVLWDNTVDKTGQAGIIRLTPSFDPFDAQANDFLNDLNAGIQSFDTGGLFKIGLMGASATSWAIMQKVMDLFPLQICITFAIIFVFIAIVFRSIYIPLRMIITVAYTVAFSLGAGVFIFQYGWSHCMWTQMHGVRSYSWTVPIFAFSLLCALALDYDVFLLTRLVELHQLGYEPDAAVAKAVWRTGRIISFAGVVMAISFGSMVFSDITMLNQFGFICAIAVLLDTFVIRSLLVPALMSLSTRVAWWPRTFAPPTLTVDDMDE